MHYTIHLCIFHKINAVSKLLLGGRVRGISRITARFRRYFARLRAVFARFHVPYRRVIATITRKPADCTVAEMRDFANTRYTKLVIILARTLLERICVDYGGIFVNTLPGSHPTSVAVIQWLLFMCKICTNGLLSVANTLKRSFCPKIVF